MIRGVEERQIVTLELPGHEPIQASVEKVGEGSLVLALYIDPDNPPTLPEGPEALLRVAVPRGVYEVAGRMRWQGVGASVARFDLAGEPRLVQRRDYARVDAYIPVTVSRGEGGELRHTNTLNVSGSGVLLAGPEDLEVGDELWLAIQIAEGDPPIEARGRVMRVTEEGYKGVRIESISERDQDRLVALVFERQRRERQVRNS
ncbi:MAG: PilZ domain-containing protein [Thermoleophilaceae bacterium]|nr:PilZ domain-containing protein [Thermoleophilaceae bacterium]